MERGTISPLSTAYQAAQRGSPRQTYATRLQSPPLGGGTEPLLAQPLPQTSRQLRENRSQLCCPTFFSRRPDLLETDNHY